LTINKQKNEKQNTNASKPKESFLVHIITLYELFLAHIM